MREVRLAPVPQRPAANRSMIIALATVATAVVVTIGLVGGITLLGPGRDAGGGPGSSPTPSTTPGATTAPPSSEGAGQLSACRLVRPGTTELVGDGTGATIMQIRDVAIECETSSGDPRLSGTITFTYHADGPNDYELETWGTVQLSGTDGAWTGVWRGSVESWGFARHRELSGVLLGQGEYDGLRVRWRLDNRHGGGVEDSPLAIPADSMTGTVERVAIVPPNGTILISGSVGCAADAGTITEVEGATQVREAVLTCTDSVASDPRLNGQTRTIVNGVRQADGSAVLWGTEEISLDGAVIWSGSYDAAVAIGYTTHRMTGSDLGRGPYADLVYEFTTIGDPETGYVTSGTISRIP